MKRRVIGFPQGNQTYLAPSAARTTTGSGSVFPVDNRGQVAKLDVTAVTAVTLVVVIEESPTGAGGWTTHSSFASRTTTGSQIIELRKRTQPFVRASWTITGTSVTFSVQTADDVARLL